MMKYSISKGEMREYSELMFIKMTISKNAAFPEKLNNRYFFLQRRIKKLSTQKQWHTIQAHYKKLMLAKKNKLQICDHANVCGMTEVCKEAGPHYKSKDCPDGIRTCKSESYRTFNSVTPDPEESFWATCRQYIEVIDWYNLKSEAERMGEAYG